MFRAVYDSVFDVLQFFSYRKMIADELFWSNVRKAGTRAFWSGFAFDVAGLLFLVYRGFTGGFDRVALEESSVTMEIGLYMQHMYSMLFFIGNLVLMLCVFAVSMMRFKKQEKRFLSAQEEREV